MPPFPKPRFDYTYDVAAQTKALRRYRDTEPGRAIPKKGAGRLLLATWNIANLGVQDRSDDDYQLIAEVMSWFDLVAVQEVNDNLRGIEAIHDRLAEALPAALLGRVREPGASGVPVRHGQGLPASGDRATLDPAELDEADQAPRDDDGLSRFRPGAVPRQLRERLVPLLARERPPLLRLAEEGGRRAPGPRDLRGRVVGEQAPQRPPHLRAGHDPARRLQPAEGLEGRSDLRRAHLPRARDPRAHLRRSARRSPPTATTTRSRFFPGLRRTASRAR